MSSKVPVWLNKDFTQKVLRNSENDESIEVFDLVTEPAVEEGENYGSIIIRSRMKYSRGKSGIKLSEKISLIIKIAHSVEGSAKEQLAKFKTFQTEINMMNTTLIKMSDILKEKDHRLNARVLYTEIGDPSLLVIEDLAPLGYRMGDQQVGLDLEHCILVMKRLAVFHASSVALAEKDLREMTTYDKGMCNENYPEFWREFFTGSMRTIASEILKWPELGPSARIYSGKLLKLSKVCYETAIRCSEPKNDEFNVLNHGDCWINNMLFRYNEDGEVISHIFVDFQGSLWSSPVIDILHFLNTSIAEDVDIHHRNALLREYLDTLGGTMKRLCCKTKTPSVAELEKTLKERELYGIILSSVMLPLMLLDKHEKKSIEEILHLNAGNDNPIYRGSAYRKIMIRKLPEWNARGAIEV